MIRFGIELGRRTTRVGLVDDQAVRVLHEAPTPRDGSHNDVMEQMCSLLERFPVDQAGSIGVSVPGRVDADTRIVYDMDAIPAWREEALGALLEERYGIPTAVQHAAHCFSLAEFHYGEGRGQSPLVGVILERGMTAGGVVDGTLMTGRNGAAGAFGALPYKDSSYGAYCAGRFVERQSDLSAAAILERAEAGDEEAIVLFEKMGTHLGRALQSVLHTVDPACIVLGGAVRQAHPYFEDAMWEALQTVSSPRALENLNIYLSQLKRATVLGAAALGRMRGKR